MKKPWILKIISQRRYVEKGHRRSNREYVDRNFAVIPTLFYIQKHLFFSDVTDSDSDQPEQAPRACRAEKQKNDQEAIQIDEFPQGPKGYVQHRAGSRRLQPSGGEGDPRHHGVDRQFCFGKFSTTLSQWKEPKASHRMYITAGKGDIIHWGR